MNANNVYQEVIQDKHHVHMNSTKWAALMDFVQYLGKAGKCVVDETERGWYVTYIEKDPALLERQEAHIRRVESEKKEEAKAAKRLARQRAEAAAALDRAGGKLLVEASKMERRQESGPIALSLAAVGVGKKRKGGGGAKKSVLDVDDVEDDEKQGKSGNEIAINEVSLLDGTDERKRSQWGIKGEKVDNYKTKKPKLRNDLALVGQSGIPINNEDAIQQETKSKQKDYWLRKDIIVRIISKKLAKGAYHKRKGIVERVIDKYTAEVEIFDSGPNVSDGGDILRLDQDDLETVMPKEGKRARILNGPGRGEVAEVLELDKRRYRGTLRVLKTGEILKKVDFEDFSKTV